MCCACCLFSQNKPRLGILPFTGGTGGDGETIASLFSYEKDIQEAFTIVPRTSAVNAVIAEQDFQTRSGYTDSDTIAGLGKMLNADFVVSGHIRRLGKSNLVITTIVNVETFEQMAGDYRAYRNIEEVRGMMPAISKRMITASRRGALPLPKLAIAPFNIANTGVNVEDAEALAQILAVEISNTGRYAVLPRTSAMQAAIKELNFQMSGNTADEGAKALGKAINAGYVLSAEVRKLGAMNMFTAQILDVENGQQIAGDSRNYQVVDDGIKLMAELALLLTYPEDAAARIRRMNREKRHTALFEDMSRFWSVGASAGTSFAAPWVIGAVHGTLAPFSNSFLELGMDFGVVSGIADAESYYSLYPFVHYAWYIPFTLPVGRQGVSGGWYAGVGAGYMLGEYAFPEIKIPVNEFAVDLIAGVNIWNMLDISYTLRTNFKSANNKLAVGYTYRFR